MADTAKGRYEELKPARRPFLDRARHCSKLTIPSLVPPENHNAASLLPEPNQGLGSRLVVSLAARIMMALLPPGRKAFMLGITPEALAKAGEAAVDEDVESAMVLTEDIISSEIERSGWRAPTNVSLQHLIVAGNVMEQMLPDNTIRTYRLDQFVVVRSPSGALLEFVIDDALDASSLTGKLKQMHDAKNSGDREGQSGTKQVHLYTWGKFDGNQWTVHQELNEERVPDSEGTYDYVTFPFSALRWVTVAGEDYGRSKVEEHLPDIRTVDGLSKAIRDGSAMASRNITLIKPNAASGMNLLRKIRRAENGDCLIGNPEDVEMLQFTNGSGLQLAQTEIAILREELANAFLVTQAAIRDAERVTATEIRTVAQEIESVLGGIYSVLSQEMMRKRIDRLIWQMQSNGQLPEWPEGMVEPTILTGLEALGRENDVNDVVLASQMVGQMPPRAHDYVKWNVLLKKSFNGLNLADAIKSEEQVAQEDQQRAEMQAAQEMVSKGTGPAVQAATQG